LAKQSTNFPRDGQRTEIRRKELDKRVNNDQMALSCHYAALQNKTPIYGAYTVGFVEQFNLRISVKVNGFTKAQINIPCMILPRVK